jgi:hypothetical protein
LTLSEAEQQHGKQEAVESVNNTPASSAERDRHKPPLRVCEEGDQAKEDANHRSILPVQQCDNAEAHVDEDKAV